MAIDRKISIGKWSAMTGYDSATQFPMKITDLAGDGTSVAGKTLVGKSDGSGNFELVTVSGTGDVSGPGSSTDNAVVRWNGVGGTSIQNSAAILDDNDNLYLPGTLNVTDAVDFDSTLNVDGNVTTGGDITQTVSGTGLAEHTLTSYAANANASQIYQQKSRGTSGTPAIVQTDDFLGNLRFDAYDGTGFVRVMSQRVRVEGTPGAGDVRGRMIWAAGQQTTPNSDPEDVLMTLTASNANPRLGNLDVTGDISVRGISVGSGGISGSGLSSTTSVIAAIDTDNNSTSEVFAVRSNGLGTNQFSVSEAGNIIGLGTLTLGSGPTTVTDSAGKVLSAALNTVGVAQGGSGATTLTGLLQGNGTSAFTAITNSTTVGQVLRVTGSNTYAWGALDLADTDAVTGILASGYGGTGNGFTKFTGPTTSEKTFTLPNSNATLHYEGGTIGATTPSTGAFTTLSATSTVTVTGQATFTSSSYPPIRNVRQTATTNSVLGAFAVQLDLTSGSMADGYGPALVFEGDGGGSLGQIAASRNGADTTGKILLRPAITGTATTKVEVTGTGMTFGSASTDTITCTGRLIPRTIGSGSVALNEGEIAYRSGNWYGAYTTTGTYTPVRFLTSADTTVATLSSFQHHFDVPGTIFLDGTDDEITKYVALPPLYAGGAISVDVWYKLTVDGSAGEEIALKVTADAMASAGTFLTPSTVIGSVTYVDVSTKAAVNTYKATFTGTPGGTLSAGNLLALNLKRLASTDARDDYLESIRVYGVRVTYS